MAYNADERFNILEQRDKKLRELRKRRGVDESQVMRGTCADMCPEKERYLREHGKQLNIFEQVSGSDSRADHDRMVKEYSRSSADQEEPLAHELRPSSILRKTMNYLLSNIVNLLPSDVNASSLSARYADNKAQTQSTVQFGNVRVGIGDWYQFLWDRMRAIRKDITQQRLADRTTVELIEKCARYHIFCAARLCAEAEHDFDAKLNQQNLENCLQTLKELYDDAFERSTRAAETGVITQSTVRNELEFRCYILLIYVQDSATFNRHLLSMRPELRNTPEVQRCVDVYRAYFAKNFVRFFRLVSALPPLHAALLHRAFLTMRIDAVVMLHRSFGFAPKSSGLPLAFFIELLAFDGEADAILFCRACNLQVEPDAAGELCIILDRSVAVSYREGPWNRVRSIRLIESKIKVTIGELINGEPLGKVQIVPARCSFDASGRLMPRSASRQDSIRSEHSEQLSASASALGQPAENLNADDEQDLDDNVEPAAVDDVDAEWPEDIGPDGLPLESYGDEGAAEEDADADYDNDGEDYSTWAVDTATDNDACAAEDFNYGNQFSGVTPLQLGALIAETAEDLFNELCIETVEHDSRLVAQFELSSAIRERDRLVELREVVSSETLLTVLNDVINDAVSRAAGETMQQLHAEANAKAQAVAKAEAEAEAERARERERVQQCEASLVQSILDEIVMEEALRVLTARRRAAQLAERCRTLRSNLQRSALNRAWTVWKTKAAAAAQRRSAATVDSPTIGQFFTFDQFLQPAATEEKEADAAFFSDNLRSEKFNYDKVFRNLLDSLTLQLQTTFNIVIRIGVAAEEPKWLLNKLRNVPSYMYKSLPPAIGNTLIGSFRSGTVDLEVHDVSSQHAASEIAVPLLSVIRVRTRTSLFAQVSDEASHDHSQDQDRPGQPPFNRYVDAPHDHEACSIRKFYGEFVRQLVLAVRDCNSWIAQAYEAKSLVLDCLFDAASTYLADRRQFDAADFVKVLSSVMQSDTRITQQLATYFTFLWHITDLFTKFSSVEHFLVDLFTVDSSIVLKLDCLEQNTLRSGLFDVADQLFSMYSTVQSVVIYEAQLQLIDSLDRLLSHATDTKLGKRDWMRFVVSCFERLFRHKVVVWLAIIENHQSDPALTVHFTESVRELLRVRRAPPASALASDAVHASNDGENAQNAKRLRLDRPIDVERKREFSELYQRLERLRNAIREEKMKTQLNT